MEVCFENENAIRNISLLEESLTALKEGNYSEAVEHGLMGICASGNAAYFDEDTCKYFNDRLASPMNGTWAYGRMSGAITEVDAVIRSLEIDADIADELEAIEKIIEQQKSALAIIYENQNASLVSIMDAMNRITDAQPKKSEDKL
jgi:hypothetical protein